MKLSLAISPCPNDTFAFDAMLNGKIDTEDLEFNYILTDIENLNKKAINGETDIIKLSFPTFFSVIKKYVLLNSGSALGFGCGPLLISKNEIQKNEIAKLKIAIPGKHTTANLLMSIAFPEAKNKTEILFSEIENEILKNNFDAGVIIHESRFTFEEKGLKKIIDLGEWWEQSTGSPIPLGCIVAKKNLNEKTINKFDRVLKKSVEFALKNPNSSYNFVKSRAQEMDDDVIRKHIELYVNKFTVDLGNKGKQAVEKLYIKAKKLGYIEDTDLMFL